MAELLHFSRAGVQGPMLAAPPAVHPVVPPRDPAFPAGAWLPPSPNPREGLAQDAGLRHKQAEPYVGAAAAAAEALGDDLIGRAPRRTPSGVAAPYQKEAAQRAAERAIRPWDPGAGLGERRGAPLLQVAGSNTGAGAFADPAAPSLFAPPGHAEANAAAAAAGRVARRGQDQGAARGAYAPREGAPARELWPAALAQQPPKYCTACRGGHDRARERDPSWQPYTPQTRLSNLQLLDTKFARAMSKGMLAFSLSESYWEPVRWSCQPRALGEQAFRQQLALAFEGVREGHEPHRFLASRAAEELLACPGRGPQVAAAVPDLVAPLKLCLNTLQPQLVGGLLLLLARLLRCHPSVPAALAPYLRHLLPPLALFRPHTARMELPAPVCVAPAGTFTGRGTPPEAGGRSCRVCGAPVDRQHDAAAARAAAAAELARNGTILGAAAAADPDAGLPAPAAKRLPGRVCGKYSLAELIEEVLGLLAGGGGEVARRVIRSYVPSFGYVPPQDQSRCLIVEELAQKAAATASPSRRRRPASAPRNAAQPRRPATAGGARAGAGAASRKPRGRRHTASHDGGGDSGGGDGELPPPPPGYSFSALSAADLARWDGLELQDSPLPYTDDVRRSAPVETWPGDGGGDGGGGPVLSVLTPVPVFDSPHDPLFRMLAEERQAGAESARRSVTFAHAGPEATRKGGARRGGAGGAGGRPASANVEVPFKASPASLRRGF